MTDAVVVPLVGPAGATFGAVVQCEPDLTVAAVRTSVADTLPPWSWPRALTLVRSLPRLPNGKTDRRACIALLEGSSARDGPRPAPDRRSGRSLTRVAGPSRTPADSGPDTRLSGAGFWLDSIELLEVIVACEAEFGITFDAMRDLTGSALETLGSLADLVRSKRVGAASGS